VNGRIIWADVFASSDLLSKSGRSWCAPMPRRPVVTRAKSIDVTANQAQAFLAIWRAAAKPSRASPEFIATRNHRRRIQSLLADFTLFFAENWF